MAEKMHTITLRDNGEQFPCSGERNLLAGMVALGRKGIPVGCRGGGCGVCKVQVLDGDYRRQVMSRAHVSVEEEAQGFALACRTFPQSDLSISVVGKIKKAF